MKAQRQYTIYIRADGSVEGTDKILREGDVYALTGDISGGIKVERNSTVIDGVGYTLQGNGEGNGIDLSMLSLSHRIFNVTVKNLQIIDFGAGINSVNNNTIIGNHIIGYSVGIGRMGGSITNVIKNNTLANNGNALSISYSKGNHVITQNNMINSVVSSNNEIIVWLSDQPTVDRNYWSDYTGRDSDGDSIGDTPHICVVGDETIYIDYHPLIEPVPVIPEFPSWILLLILIITATVLTLFYKRKLNKGNTI